MISGTRSRQLGESKKLDLAASVSSASFVSSLMLFLSFMFISGPADAQTRPLLPETRPLVCQRTINAKVVALPQPIMLNRLGAAIPDGLVFALRKDTVPGSNPVRLKDTKRPRPLVLRANVGDCLKITFTNSIPASAFGTTKVAAPTGTQEVSLHVQGMQWIKGSQDDGSFVGVNDSSLASAVPAPSPMPPQTQTYTLYAKEEGTFLLYTMGDTSSTGDQLTRGLFGALNVQPAGAEWYRSQVTADDLALATYNANSLPANASISAGDCTAAAPCTLEFTGPNARQIKVIKTANGSLNTTDNYPLIDYDAVYPEQRADGTKVPAQMVGTPILKMLDADKNIVHSDLTAMITGPNAGRFPGTTGLNNPEPDCNAENNPALDPPPGGKVDPLFCTNPASPDRKQPYREITVIYHGALSPIAAQAFPVLSNDSSMAQTLQAGQDAFAINYGTGGIGAEIYANRIGVGPMGDCIDCKFEEFFLSAWSVGDPAMLVDIPANSKLPPPSPSPATPPIPPPPPLCTTEDLEGGKNPDCANARTDPKTGDPTSGFPYKLAPLAKATRVYYSDDPSNVYHSYINDHVKFRILHGGRDVTHVHHQHAHQWLQSPNSDQSSYLDSQMISPGASYTLEITYNGSGNRNKVVGDSIFHCHFYPHFAAGMWAMWRTHDVFESGTFVYPEDTTLNGKDVSGQVVPGSRALPDGEIIAGTPNPAVVPLPTLPMAPLPAYTQIQNKVEVNGVQIETGGQIVIGGTCQSDKISGLDVIGGCTDGQVLNGTVIDSQFDGKQITGQFQPSGNQLKNPGFPFFIPGVAGARAPHPPFDFAPDGAGGFMDGGLPRHVVTGGSVSNESHNEFDWSKDLAALDAVGLPETGTVVELAAIDFFKQRCHETSLPDGSPSNCAQPKPFGFIVNGLPIGPQPGAPFADPAVDDDGNPIGAKRTYKAAALQLNATFNKKGWHYPQQRMLALWEDVQPTIDFTNGKPGRQPEPLFFRGNSGDIIEYWHTNLVPHYYLVDDFQVRTPTDILGQHIHLVKFDVTSSDGAGNGFNYEDGTFAADEVQDLIKAINANGGLVVNGTKQPLPGPKKPPQEIFDCAANPKALRCQPCPEHPTDYDPQCLSWLGAQTTIQRWYLDPVEDNSGVDRTLRTVFTHDHFGPSTHQQAGLYAGLLVEPKGSSWRNSEDGSLMGRPAPQPPLRPDGGPTSWKADILTKDKDRNDVSYREFALEFQDLQLAYAVATMSGTSPPITAPNPDPERGWRDPKYAIGAPGTPSLITTGIPAVPAGTQSVNYTNEPLAWRIGSSSVIGTGKLSDLSYAYDNSIQKTVNPLDNPDPMTPLMRAYQNDNVQIRLLVGAHVFSHQFNLEGPTWFAEPSWKNSGYRSAQAMGLSEHFELLFQVPSSSAPKTGRKCPDGMSQANCVDYLYSPSLNESGLANGLWGLFRAYDPTTVAKKLQPLPNNPIGPSADVSYSTCPGKPNRVFNITAVTAQKALALRSPICGQTPAKGQIVFNDRGSPPNPPNPPNCPNILSNNLGIMYVRSEELDQGKLKPGVPIEPVILRANAGDCIEMNLTNAIDEYSDIFDREFKMAPPLRGPPYPTKVSRFVGLHPQLLSYDAAQSNGINVGWNSKDQKDQVVGFGKTITYTWYAGKIDRDSSGQLTHTPVEFGALNLFPSDPVFQHINGLFGSMIIEPLGATWKCGEAEKLADCDPSDPPADPPTTRASATVTLAKGKTFRDFALMISDAMIIKNGNSGAVNYRTEPTVFRYADNPDAKDFSCMLSNRLIQPAPEDPQTPIFTAKVGDKVRFRLTHPFGTGTSQVFTLHGHVWQWNPYKNDSREIGHNSLSQWQGSRDNHASTDHFDLVVDKAGGAGRKPGDYLYTVFQPLQATQGAWGIFRVGRKGKQPKPNAACEPVKKVAPRAVPQREFVVPPPQNLNRFIRQPSN